MPDPVDVDLGSHRLRVQVEGSGSPTLLCLHGLVDSAAIWDRLAPGLARRGRVIRLDQRAHGASEAPPGPYERADLVADVIGVLDALGVERALLVGHSMGGIVAMATALAKPERVAGLVLIGSASECSERVAGWYERLARSAETEGLDGLRTAIYGPRSRKRIEGDAQGIAHVTRTLRSLYHDPLTPKLATLVCPALLLVGSADPMGPGASVRIQRSLPGAELRVIPDRGHWLHVEVPDLVLEQMESHGCFEA